MEVRVSLAQIGTCLINGFPTQQERVANQVPRVVVFLHALSRDSSNKEIFIPKNAVVGGQNAACNTFIL
jgi:hypothetical protein